MLDFKQQTCRYFIPITVPIIIFMYVHIICDSYSHISADPMFNITCTDIHSKGYKGYLYDSNGKFCKNTIFDIGPGTLKFILAFALGTFITMFLMISYCAQYSQKINFDPVKGPLFINKESHEIEKEDNK